MENEVSLNGLSHYMALYYLSYLAEGELHKLDESTKFTIAPDCVGSRGGRCNFEELMLHIWAPKKEGDKKPTGFKKIAGIDAKNLPNLESTSAFNKFIGGIENARFNTGELLTGQVDVGKLMPGKADFYDALSSIGDPIGALAAKADKDKKPDEGAVPKKPTDQDKLLKLGKASAFYISALRGKDQDKHRRVFLQKYFEKKFPSEEGKEKIKIEIEMMNVETPMDKKEPEEDKTKRKGKVPKWVPQSVPMIDFAKTIEKNKDKLERLEEELEKANAEFMAKETETNGKMERLNEAHKKAFVASKMAATATGCTRELPRELKKRDPLAELSLRSPKAARSVRVKARKLGFTM
ncbi:hypothetical protein TrVFT333_007127 [Trichoderma virens FT-333]|nr:hypothetical protein TrVFT333_007127 [Trichoderma virens FT-333]